MTAPPQAVVDLAGRLGARKHGGTARLQQTGTMRQLGAERWMGFSARQWIASQRCAFSWQARFGPLGMICVEDALVGNAPRGKVTLAGILPLSSAQPCDALLKGQLMRYLAELPWAPDALLANPALHWQVLNAGALKVQATIGQVTGAITMQLDEEGLPQGITGMRPAQEGKSFVEREWHGAFADYREVDGCLIPHAGRVSWIVDGQACEVWRGEVTAWQRVAD